MIKWEIKNNCINKLFFNHQNIIFPWGIETADSSSFFSLEKSFGYRYKILHQEQNNSTTFSNLKIRTKMKEGLWCLELNDTLKDNKITRNAKLLCEEDSIFMDFVIRFRFKRKYYSSAEINNRKIIHHNSNIYYQYPVSQINLYGNTHNIIISIEDMIIPDNLQQYMYVRDYNDEWIIHVRLLPKIIHKEVIKLCTKWFQTRPLPQWLSKRLLSVKKIKQAMWYRGEQGKLYQNKILQNIFNPNAFGMAFLPKGSIISIKVKTEIMNNR